MIFNYNKTSNLWRDGLGDVAMKGAPGRALSHANALFLNKLRRNL
jgi:hypothetical protein